MQNIIVTTFNLERGCEAYGTQQAVNLIKESNCNVALLQETYTTSDIDMTQDIAKQLNWNFKPFKVSGVSIISPYEMEFIAEGRFFGLVKIMDVYFFVLHIDDYPYIAFEACDIPYSYDGVEPFKSKDPDLLKYRSFDARKESIFEFKAIIDTLPKDSIIIIGADLNEPSYLDWIDGREDIPFSIDFPLTRFINDLGFIDTFRTIYPDPIKNKGYTWPDRIPNYKYRYDRIDYIFSKNIEPKSSFVLNTKVSDHSIVTTTFKSIRSFNHYKNILKRQIIQILRYF